MVTYMDMQVGHIIEKLKALGVYDNSIIFFTSDNGPTYAGGADSGFFDSAAPFSSEEGRGKGSVYEGGIRVPLIVQWPGRIPENSKSDLIGAFYDVMPTLCDLAGITVPDNIDGLSILPTLTSQGGQTEHEFLYWEFPSYGGQQAVRMGDWKGIRRNMFDGNLDMELYDLSSDIGETIDVASENPDVVAKMELIMREQHQATTIDRFKFEILGD
jgi:arylsulfatase